VPPVRKIQLL